MRSLYDTLTQFKGGDSDFSEYLTDMKLDRIFGNLSGVYPSKHKVRRAILYIVYAYSRDSQYVLLGESWETVKQRASEKAELDEEQIAELVRFEFKFVPKEKEETKATKARGKEEVSEISDEEVEEAIDEMVANENNVAKIVRTINLYLDYQNDRVNKHLRRMYELYEQLSTASVTMITKNAKGTIDWEQKASCQKEANRLYGEIETWEQKLGTQNANLRPASDEVKAIGKKIVRALRPEVM